LGSQDPFLTARELELRLQLLPLLRRRLVVDSVLVEAPVVNLVRTASGALNLDSLGKRTPAPGAPAAAGAAAAAVPPAFQLGSLRLRHGTVRYRDLSTGRTVELTDVAVDARQPQFDAPVPVALRARLATADLHLDDIVSEGLLELAGERARYRGSLRAGPGAFGPVAVNGLTAELRASPPVLDLESAKLETLGGTVEGSAHLTSEGKSAGVTAQLDARGLDLDKVPAPKNRPQPAGTLELHGTLAGPPPEVPTFASGATGQGRFAVADGRLEGAGFGRPVLDALQAFLKPGVADRLRERYPDLFASDDLRFTRLSGSGRLAGGRIRSDDLVLAAPSYEAHGEGSLGLDGDLDATLQLVASPALTDDLLGQSKARPVLVDTSGRLAIPLRVRGPVGRPHVTPDPAFAATVARALLGGSEAGQAAGDLIERLFGGKRKRDR
ncbi:MAG TPA: AsmA-like C-terminal region-containing protein, partial [Verrucomicrobiae bacterium]|nr:AsmA-like C-terminal region-containing protein [Verrucomicrobiae bacterium]